MVIIVVVVARRIFFSFLFSLDDRMKKREKLKCRPLRRRDLVVVADGQKSIHLFLLRFRSRSRFSS